jgi:hypothetical protein
MLYLSKLYIEVMLEYPTWILVTDILITSIPIYIIIVIIKEIILANKKKEK